MTLVNIAGWAEFLNTNAGGARVDWFFLPISYKPVYLSGSVISLHIDDEQKRRLDMLSQRTGSPNSVYLREALGAGPGDCLW